MAASHASHLADPDKNPSFTRGVFQGEILEDLVFPFPEPSAEEKETLSQILDSFRSWAADTVNSAQMDHDGKFPDEVRKGMAELGLMGLNIPEEYGGFGASAMVFTRVFGEVGAVDAALAVYFGAHQSIGIKGIILFGTEEQKQRWLPRCANGELIGAFCLTERAPARTRKQCSPPQYPTRTARPTRSTAPRCGSPTLATLASSPSLPRYQ
jgi:acyl-CoA dehydrogenase family member 9